MQMIFAWRGFTRGERLLAGVFRRNRVFLNVKLAKFAQRTCNSLNGSENSFSESTVGTKDCIGNFWFYVSNVPKYSQRKYHKYDSKRQVIWKKFSDEDSEVLEQAYKRLNSENANLEQLKNRGVHKVSVREDLLYEADLVNMELYPIYWKGAVYTIRRAIWFFVSFAGISYSPCDEVLSNQLEEGFLQYLSLLRSGPSSGETNSWALRGEYSGQRVVYAKGEVAYSVSNILPDGISKTILGFTGGKYVRGWDRMKSLIEKAKSKSLNGNTPCDKKSDGPSALNLESLDQEVSLNQEVLDQEVSLNQEVLDQEVLDQEVLDQEVLDQEVLLNREELDREVPLNPKEDLGNQKISPDEDYPPRLSDINITHLVFAVHGVGQRSAEATSVVDFEQDCSDLRESIKNIVSGKTSADPEIWDIFGKRKCKINIPPNEGVQVLPIFWRDHLDISFSGNQEAVDLYDVAAEDTLRTDKYYPDIPMLEEIQQKSTPSYLKVITNALHDIILYENNTYRQQILLRAAKELNNVYMEYKKRNPQFNGKVSIYGHSIGSLIAFDILCGPNNSDTASKNAANPKSTVDVNKFAAVFGDLLSYKSINSAPCQQPDIPLSLNFDVDNLFMVGSPVGFYLFLRGKKLGYGQNAIYPRVESLYNLFYTSDAVAHRIEPLVYKKYPVLQPAVIGQRRSADQIYLESLSLLGKEIVNKSLNFYNSAKTGIANTAFDFANTITKMSMLAQGTLKSSQEIPEVHKKIIVQDTPADTRDLFSILISDSGGSHSPREEARIKKSLDEFKMFNPNKRLDFALNEEGFFRSSAIMALSSHFSYWRNTDCNSFIVSQLYKKRSDQD